MPIGIFSVRVRPDADPGKVAEAHRQMAERVAARAEFDLVSAKAYRSAEDEAVVITQFGSAEGFEAWRTDPERAAALEHGRAEWLDEYWGGEVLPRVRWDRTDGRTAYDARELADGPFTIAFSVKLRQGADAVAFQTEAFRLLEVLGDGPQFGFRGVRIYQSEDGAMLVLVEYASLAGLQAWNEDPEHKAGMERGRAEWLEYGWSGELVVQETWVRERAS